MSIYVFMLYMVVTSAVMLLAPELLPVDEPPPYAFIQLIGVKELALCIALYAPAAAGERREMMVLTAWGRLSTIVWSALLVALRDAPNSVLFGVLPDVAGALYTLLAAALDRDEEKSTVTATDSALAPVQRTIAEHATRGFIIVVGAVELFTGLSTMLSSTSTFPSGLDIALRSFAMATGIIGAYQVAIGLSQSLRPLYSGVAMYHLVCAALMRWLKLEAREHRAREMLHAMIALALHVLLYACPISESDARPKATHKKQ